MGLVWAEWECGADVLLCCSSSNLLNKPADLPRVPGEIHTCSVILPISDKGTHWGFPSKQSYIIFAALAKLKRPFCLFQTYMPIYIPAVIFTFALHLQMLSWALNMTKLKTAPCGIGINTFVNSFLHWWHKEDALSYSGSCHQHAGAVPAHSFWVPLAGSMVPPTPMCRQLWGLFVLYGGMFLFSISPLPVPVILYLSLLSFCQPTLASSHGPPVSSPSLWLLWHQEGAEGWATSSKSSTLTTWHQYFQHFPCLTQLLSHRQKVHGSLCSLLLEPIFTPASPAARASQSMPWGVKAGHMPLCRQLKGCWGEHFKQWMFWKASLLSWSRCSSACCICALGCMAGKQLLLPQGAFSSPGSCLPAWALAGETRRFRRGLYLA